MRLERLYQDRTVHRLLLGQAPRIEHVNRERMDLLESTAQHVEEPEAQWVATFALMLGTPVVAYLGIAIGMPMVGMAAAMILASQMFRFNSTRNGFVQSVRIIRQVHDAAQRRQVRDRHAADGLNMQRLATAATRYNLATMTGIPLSFLLQAGALLLQLVGSPVSIGIAFLVIPASLLVFAVSVFWMCTERNVINRTVQEVLGGE